MKQRIFILVASLFASGFLFGQGVTDPIGFVTQPLYQGYNLLGLTLHTPTLAAGTFDVVNGVQLTDHELTFSPTSGRTYVLEITSGGLNGTIQEIHSSAMAGTVVTTPDNLQAAVPQGLQPGASYRIRIAPTLEEIFTTTSLANGGVLAAALNIANSDLIWVPTAPGVYEKYFLRSSGGFQRVTGTSTFTPAPNVPLIYVDAVQIQKRTTAAASLTVVGEVKKQPTNFLLGQGYNLISMVAPTGLTLRNAGFEDDLAKALNSANSDVVWVQKPNLAFDKYYYHSTQGWRYVDTNLNLPALTDPPLGSAVYVQRRSLTPTVLDINAPTIH